MQNTIIDNYKLTNFLGKGGMAEVWLGENLSGQKAAIKIMLLDHLNNEHIIDRFKREAVAMQLLNHPNIRSIYSSGIYAGRPYIIMEYLQGNDLSSFIEHRNIPNQNLIKIWWEQAIKAINYTHEQNIIHRDIKPSNIFIDQNNNLKILDFGIAKLKFSSGFKDTHTNQSLFSPYYSSPEQVHNSINVTTASDIFSLAISFFAILKGDFPYEKKESFFQIQENMINVNINFKGINKEWKALLEPCLQKESNKRPTAAQLLQKIISEQPTVDDKTIFITGNDETLWVENKDGNIKKTNYRMPLIVGGIVLVLTLILIPIFKNTTPTDYPEPAVESLDSTATPTDVAIDEPVTSTTPVSSSTTSTQTHEEWRSAYLNKYKKLHNSEYSRTNEQNLREYKALLNTLPSDASTERSQVKKRITFFVDAINKEEQKAIAENKRAEEERRRLEEEKRRLEEEKRRKIEESRVDMDTYNKKMDLVKSQISNMNNVTGSDKNFFKNDIIKKLKEALKAKPNDPEALRLLKHYQ